MKSILGEYSLAVMYCIVVISVITILFFALNNEDSGMIFTYNTNMLYANDFYAGTITEGNTLAELEASGKLDNTDNISNIVTVLHKPTFTVDDSVVGDDFILNVPTLPEGVTKTYYTYDELIELFSANGKIDLNKWNGSTYINVGLPNTVEIVVSKLIPSVRGVDGTLETEWVEAKDKFGSVILDSNGEPKLIERVVYTEEVYSRDNVSEFFIDWDVSCRYRVLFRFTDGTLKSEYSTMFANKIRPATDIYEEVYEEWSTIE